MRGRDVGGRRREQPARAGLEGGSGGGGGPRLLDVQAVAAVRLRAAVAVGDQAGVVCELKGDTFSISALHLAIKSPVFL